MPPSLHTIFSGWNNNVEYNGRRRTCIYMWDLLNKDLVRLTMNYLNLMLFADEALYRLLLRNTCVRLNLVYVCI